MKPLEAQSPEFWQTTFQFTSQQLEDLQQRILDLGTPLSIDEIGLSIVRDVVEQEKEKLWAELTQGKTYRPDQAYEVGDKLIFPKFDFVMGTILSQRDGYHPEEGTFTVIEVEFDTPDQSRAKFATNLSRSHNLSTGMGQDIDMGADEATAQKIYQQHQYIIRTQIEPKLRQNNAFVTFNHHWFLTDLLISVEDGLLNIVDAAIDLNGAPLNVDDLVEQMELLDGEEINDALRFSVNYRLNNDERFENVGTETLVLWYLLRLKPSEIRQPPFRLRDVQFSFDSSVLSDEQKHFLADIEDDVTPVDYVNTPDPEADTGRLTLSYPYWRTGIVPIVPAIEYLLPEATSDLTYLPLIDGRTGELVSAWYISDFNYIAGLSQWFQQHNLPVGTFINFSKTDDPTKLVLDYEPSRPRQEWVRSVKVEKDHLVFGMQKVSLACEYDELMIILDQTPDGLDQLAQKVQREQKPNSELLGQIFPELMKLTSQSAVHIKTLYSALNLVKRCPPGPLLETLVTDPYFEEIGHGYWTYKREA